MAAQSKNNVSASVLPDLSGDTEAVVSEKKEPVVVAAKPVVTPTSLEPVASDSTPTPTPASETLANMVVTETIEEPVAVEKPSPPSPVTPVAETKEENEIVSTISASVVPEVSPVEPVDEPQVPQAETKTTSVETSPTEEREEIPLEKKNAKLYKIGTILLIIILISTVGVFYMRTKTTTTIVTTEVEDVTASPTPEVTPEPTPEIVALERDEITLEILNGTSTSGLAGKTADIFEELGYEIGDIGNADDVSKSQLYVKTEFVDQLETLLEDVKDELDITEVTKEVDDLDVTAKIILGGE